MLIDYFILSLSGLSFISNLSVLIIYTIYPKLFKHPGNYLFIISLLLVFYDIYWATSYPPMHTYIDSILDICYELGVLNCTLYFFVWNYTSVLSLVIIGKSSKYAYCKSRRVLYHISCVVISIAETFGVFFLGSFGISRFRTCFITAGSDGEVIYLIPIVINFPIALMASIMMLFEKNKRDSLRPVALSLLAILITWGVLTLFNLASHFWSQVRGITDYMACLGAVSGLIFTAMRMGNSYTIQKIKRKNKGELALYFQNAATMMVNHSISMSADTMGLTDIDVLGHFLEDNNKQVR